MFQDPPALDSGTSREIGRLVKDSGNESTGSLQNKYLGGAEQTARGLLKADDSAEKRMGMNPMSEAIKRKYNQKFSGEFERLKRDTMKGAQIDHMKKLEMASNLANEEHEFNMERERIKAEMKKARKAARGAILGNVLGIAGGVVGAVYGGPAGAAAGYQLGSGAGNAVGGS